MASRSSGTSDRGRIPRGGVDLEGPRVPVVQRDPAACPWRGRGALLFLVVPSTNGSVMASARSTRRASHFGGWDAATATGQRRRPSTASAAGCPRRRTPWRGPESTRRPDGARVVEQTAEPMQLAQHGDRGSAAGRVGACSLDDVLVLVRDSPADGAGALDLGDEVEPQLRQALGDGARRRRGKGRSKELLAERVSPSARGRPAVVAQRSRGRRLAWVCGKLGAGRKLPRVPPPVRLLPSRHRPLGARRGAARGARWQVRRRWSSPPLDAVVDVSTAPWRETARRPLGVPVTSANAGSPLRIVSTILRSPRACPGRGGRCRGPGHLPRRVHLVRSIHHS